MKNNLGKILFEIQHNNCEHQKDMALRLNVSPQYLSAIATGKKRITKNFIAKITKEYNLPYSAILALSRARMNEMDKLSIDASKLSPVQREALISLLLQSDNLSQYDWQRIKAIAKRAEQAKIAINNKNSA